MARRRDKAESGVERPRANFGGPEATRRSVLSLLLATAGWSVGLGRGLAASVAELALPNLSPDVEFQPAGGFKRPHLRVMRPGDFIFLDVELDNIAQVGDPVASLQRVSPGKPALLIVHHQPQAIADQAYQQVSQTEAHNMPSRDGGSYTGQPGTEAAPTPPAVAQARMAGNSRVAFVMPADVSSIAFTLEELLKAFRTWEMNLDYQAGPQVDQHPRVTGLSAATALKTYLDQVAGPISDKLDPKGKLLFEKALQDAYSTVISRAMIGGGGQQTTDSVNALLRQMVQRHLPGAASQVIPRLGKTAGGAQFVPKIVATPSPNLHFNPKPHVPADTVTAIELPYRLVQSPLAEAGWMHRDTPETHSGRTELWHTRLGKRQAHRIDDDASMPVRAIWSPDYVNPEPEGTPFTMSLDGFDRQMLVRLTAGYDEVAGGRLNPHPYTPKPANARRFMLTALGGWLWEDGDWPAGAGPADVDLTQWNHRAAMARDYYVRVVYAGYLFPLGHAASLVKVTERRFEDQPGGGRVALLRQRFFIIVRQRTRTYPGINQKNDGRDFPFTRVDILTSVTPDLAEPGSNPDDRLPDSFYGGKPKREAFWPVTTGAYPGSLKDFMFQCVGYDQGGKRIAFTTPLFFLSINRNDPSDLAEIVKAYATVKNQARRKRPFHGAVVQFAPNVGSDPGDTKTPIVSITFAGALPTGLVPASSAEGLPAQFYPAVESAELKLPAVQRLLGNDQPVNAMVADVYLEHGLDEVANKGQVFLSLAGAGGTMPPGGQTDAGGGVVTPNIVPTAFSRTFGPVGGANAAKNFVAGTFNPKDFLGGDLKLFGVVPLGDILAPALDIKKAPQLVSQEFPDHLTSTFNLHQENLQPYTLPGTSGPIFVPDADGVASVLNVNAVATQERNGTAPAGPPKATVDGKINNFKVNLFGCVILTFDSLTYAAKPGKKPDVGINLNNDHGVLFGGPLEFVNTLKEYIPSNGFTDPPSTAVTAAGITSSYALGLPSVAVGVLALQNISLGAGFNLPFDGSSPAARFNFADKHNPFNLTVSLLGGGGFFAIAVSTAGVDEIEAQLEFGAYAALDIGVASGSVYVKGGFYYHWQQPTETVELEAFVELGGHLSVIGLISVSLTFHVDLGYHVDHGYSELIGQATLTVEVDVLFFSKSVALTVQKQFAGSKADPKFVDFIPDEATWQSYCAAFG